MGVRSRRSMSFNGLGVLGPGGVVALFSNRLKASPNLPAKRFLVPDKDIEGKLDRFDLPVGPLLRRRSFLAASVSSIVRRKSTFDSMFVSSSESGSRTTLSEGFMNNGRLSDNEGLAWASFSRRKSIFDSR
jgi:hypothetical protein